MMRVLQCSCRMFLPLNLVSSPDLVMLRLDNYLCSPLTSFLADSKGEPETNKAGKHTQSLPFKRAVTSLYGKP